MGFLSKKKKKEEPKEIEEERYEEEKTPKGKEELTQEQKVLVEEIKSEIKEFVQRYGGLYEPVDFPDPFKPEVCKLLFAMLQELKHNNQELIKVQQELISINNRLEAE